MTGITSHSARHVPYYSSASRALLGDSALLPLVGDAVDLLFFWRMVVYKYNEDVVLLFLVQCYWNSRLFDLLSLFHLPIQVVRYGHNHTHFHHHL